MTESVEHILASRPLPPSEWPRDRSLMLPAGLHLWLYKLAYLMLIRFHPSGSNYVVKKTHPNPKEPNSAITYFCQFGDPLNAPLRAVLLLLAHILKEPSFTQLRTKEQLGYVLF